jgi:hypothetical protein
MKSNFEEGLKGEEEKITIITHVNNSKLSIKFLHSFLIWFTFTTHNYFIN